jgi:hypothetical protein
MPAHAGIQRSRNWIPACAGMTEKSGTTREFLGSVMPVTTDLASVGMNQDIRREQAAGEHPLTTNRSPALQSRGARLARTGLWRLDYS